MAIRWRGDMLRADVGQVFSQKRLRETQKNFASEMGKYGYAFAKVDVLPRFDEINKTVDLTFDLKQGQRTYVRRINVRGNFRTNDVVFRREMRQLESSFYSKEAVEKSRRRIQRLAFVESVKIQTSPVVGTSGKTFRLMAVSMLIVSLPKIIPPGISGPVTNQGHSASPSRRSVRLSMKILTLTD